MSITSGATSASRGTANASYHQSPAMNTVPRMAAPSPITPSTPAAPAWRSYEATSANTSIAKATIDATPLIAWVVESTKTLSESMSAGVVSMITTRVTTTRAPATMASGPALRASNDWVM